MPRARSGSTTLPTRAAATAASSTEPTEPSTTARYTDVNRRLYGIVWDGSRWIGPATILDASGLDVADYESFTAAYERTSGNLLVAWGRESSCNSAADPLYFATKASGSTAFAAAATASVDAGLVASPGPMVAASEPGTNRIAISAYEYASCCAGNSSYCGDWNTLLWSGGWATESIKDLDSNPEGDWPKRPGTIPVAAGWLGTSGEAVTVYASAAATLSWATWHDGAGWSLQPSATLSPAIPKPTSYVAVPSGSVGTSAAGIVLFI